MEKLSEIFPELIDSMQYLGTGQQRQEIKSHIERIAEGIKNGSEIPNSILLVMDKELVVIDNPEEQPDFYVKVEGTSDEIEIEHPDIPNEFLQKVRPVKITIPYRKSAFDSEKRFMIVDGQQRTAGLTLTNQEDVATHQVPVVAILADEENSREIFKIANQTQKITIDFSRALSG
jgi:DGQHR domain-containing protein